MFSRISTTRRRPRNGLIDRFWAMLICVMLLPLPVPVAHEHDCFESPEELAIHLALRHSDSEQVLDGVSETHWHFAMPSRNGHDDCPHDGYPVDQVPSAPADYTGSLSSSSQVLSGQHPLSDLARVITCERPVWQASNAKIDQPLSWLVETAQQRHRCALSCVLRC